MADGLETSVGDWEGASDVVTGAGVGSTMEPTADVTLPTAEVNSLAAELIADGS